MQHRFISDERGRALDLEIIPSCLQYGILCFPREHRKFFPGYKVNFILERSGLGLSTAHVSSSSDGTRIGDPDAGMYIVGRLGEWYRHHEIEVGDWIRVKEIARHREYFLRRL